jgi:NAD(P)-dependent dehydrogenase (short-subunit alcohol dehydrogenase family)
VERSDRGKRARMSERTDPTTTQYPTSQPGQKQAHPGSTEQMTPRPDHGEDSYRGSGRLRGRRAVITGGDSGIGRAVAIAYAREGADVLISYLEEEQGEARRTEDAIRDAGRKAVLVPGDLRSEQHCRHIIERAVSELGGLDILVNNAAYQMAQPNGLADIGTEQLERVFTTNVYAMFWLCRAALPHLEAGASIINTTSVEAYQPAPPLLDYAASKAAILNFTQGLAQQLAPQGIRVNAVAPGPIWTPLIPATMPADGISDFGADTPLGRAGQPAELAPAYVFLASSESSYITGERIAVTGGRILP